MVENIVILDNGGYNLKIGSSRDNEPRLVPNSIVKAKHERKRVFVAQEQDECLDKFSLFYVRPVEKGYVVNWDTQQQIWEKSLKLVDIEPSTSKIVLTDSNYLVPSLPDVSSEIMFEYFNFEDILKGSASTFVAEHEYTIKNRNCSLVIDCGFSNTTISPFVDGLLIQDGVIRIDIGGKALTNKLKDWISYRQLNVIEETHIINECKEDICFVSQDFNQSLIEAKKKFEENQILRRYVMPDFHHSFRGVVKDISEGVDPNVPTITLGVERFAIPEILFSPSDIDIDQMGIGEAVIESLARCPPNLRAALSENIVVIGGSSCFPGFNSRLVKEIRSMLPVEFEIHISEKVENPQTYAWNCAKEYVNNVSYLPWLTRKDWNEKGDSIEFSHFFRTLVSSDEIKEERKKVKEIEKEKEKNENFGK
ncbi:unnamed protein product [Caenorhabditis angaria]|uniref:Actin-like protein ARP6 n=1 Tax=Caenorhabditis angaria TaxID=860376 RepID=A0A9P1ICA6_9PELO|nr:unnamed protein product [Caenorhabditis angaria]